MGSRVTFNPFFNTYKDGYRAEYCQWARRGTGVVAEIVRHTVIGGHGELTTHYEAHVGVSGAGVVFPVGRGLFNTEFEDLSQPIERMQAAYLRDYRPFQGRDLGEPSWGARAAGAKAKRWVQARLKEEVSDA